MVKKESAETQPTHTRVAIVGWHGRKNFGDDAMLEVITRQLFKDYGPLEVKLLVGSDELPKFHVPGVSWRPAWTSIQSRRSLVFRLLKPFFGLRSDVLVFGGGSIFHDSYSILWKTVILMVHRMAHPGTTRLALGVSVRPTSRMAKLVSKVLFYQLHRAVVRDRESFDLLSDFRPKNMASLTLSPDLVTALLGQLMAPKASNQKKRTIGISVHRQSNAEDEKKIVDSILSAVNYLVKKGLVGKVKILVTCVDQSEGDWLLSIYLQKSLRNFIETEVVPFNGNPSEFFVEISELSLLVSTRLHPLIVSSSIGVPSIGIHRGDKLPTVLKLVAKPLRLIDIRNLVPGDLITELSAISDSRVDSCHNPISPIPEPER